MLTMSNTSATELNLSVTGINVEKGNSNSKVTVYVFATEKGYPKVHKEALLTQSKKANKTNLHFQIQIPKNIKAISVKVHHDRNGDGKVTKNWTGIIPKDGLGFSNKQKLSLSGVPTFLRSKLTSKQLAQKQVIAIKYYSN